VENETNFWDSDDKVTEVRIRKLLGKGPYFVAGLLIEAPNAYLVIYGREGRAKEGGMPNMAEALACATRACERSGFVMLDRPTVGCAKLMPEFLPEMEF
jgi:hypothetical protein